MDEEKEVRSKNKWSHEEALCNVRHELTEGAVCTMLTPGSNPVKN